MIGNQRVLAVVPARSGSKGLPGKNLRLFLGSPLITHVGRVISDVPSIDRAVVSTDSQEIASVAQSAGIDAPFIRPFELSGDYVGDVDVLLNALEEMENLDLCTYGIVVMLQPTSPLRTAAEVIECLDIYHRNNADSVWTVSPIDKKFHPLKQLSITEGRLAYFDPRGAQIIARQQLGDLFYRNGAAYVVSRALLTERRSLLGEASYACLSRRDHISIDTAEDLALAECLAMKQRTNG